MTKRGSPRNAARRTCPKELAEPSDDVVLEPIAVDDRDDIVASGVKVGVGTLPDSPARWRLGRRGSGPAHRGCSDRTCSRRHRKQGPRRQAHGRQVRAKCHASTSPPNANSLLRPNSEMKLIRIPASRASAPAYGPPRCDRARMHGRRAARHSDPWPQHKLGGRERNPPTSSYESQSWRAIDDQFSHIIAHLRRGRRPRTPSRESHDVIHVEADCRIQRTRDEARYRRVEKAEQLEAVSPASWGYTVGAFRFENARLERASGTQARSRLKCSTTRCPDGRHRYSGTDSGNPISSVVLSPAFSLQSMTTVDVAEPPSEFPPLSDEEPIAYAQPSNQSAKPPTKIEGTDRCLQSRSCPSEIDEVSATETPPP